jgi:hypothetical protein
LDGIRRVRLEFDDLTVIASSADPAAAAAEPAITEAAAT